MEFAKQLAAVNEQPLQSEFEEMIQWMEEGKLWEFPVNNGAGFGDDGSEFHEHIFLGNSLKGFPKQGPIHCSMELVTCGLSESPYLSVKKWNTLSGLKIILMKKIDILKESDI